ncbi:RING-H2 finger protein ATL2-like [Nymphaea colorata]|uniref:RING-H2 finger protein ATL2-like n=1 Tax=Nymphaea colorata TaxID=210225 RepID=UPI00129D81EB|nr:RING-H2 finger protein ATL2-like [Nymphaea colorata]
MVWFAANNIIQKGKSARDLQKVHQICFYEILPKELKEQLTASRDGFICSSALVYLALRFSSAGASATGIAGSLPNCRCTFSTLGCSSDGPVECAICLSKFESTDDVRLLPKCKHTFHMHCIDRWLQQHSNCPVCRQKVEVQDSSPSIPLPEMQSSGLMEQGTTQSPNGESLNRDRGGSAVGDNRDAQTPVRTVEDHLLDRRLMQQLQSYGIESVCSSSDQFLQ